MRRLITARHLEVGSWIVAIIGFPLMLYQFWATVFPGAPPPATVAAAAGTSSGDRPNRAGDRPNVVQKQNSGTQVGFAETVNIHNGASEESSTESSPRAAKAQLATFNINSNGGYWEALLPDETDKYRHAQFRYTGTEYWSELANCMEFSHTKREKKTCGDAAKLLPVFDVTLVVPGRGQVVLKEIRVQITSMTEYKGDAGELPRAAIPKSATYKVQLPRIDGNTKLRIGAIPPLLIEKERPARFELLFSPGEPTECVYYLYVEFVLSSGQVIATESFALDFIQSSLPTRQDSRIPAAAKQYWRSRGAD